MKFRIHPGLTWVDFLFVLEHADRSAFRGQYNERSSYLTAQVFSCHQSDQAQNLD